jgi:Starch-binding module 26
MQSYNFATFWVEQWLKFLSAAGAWPAVDRESLDAQLAELRAGADRVEAELKSVADERSALRRNLAAAEQAAKVASDDLAEAKAELVKTRELAVEERRQLTEEIARLQQKMAEAAAAAATVAAERDSLDTARDSLARERAQLAAELDRLRKAAEEDRQRLEAAIMDMQRAGEAAKTAPAAPIPVEAVAGLEVHFKKPADWQEPLFVHYWDDGRRTAWPGEPMTVEDDGWHFHTLSGVRTATIVFNDNKGHQTPDLGRDRAGWYDGTWHDEKPGRPARRKARKKEPA